MLWTSAVFHAASSTSVFNTCSQRNPFLTLAVREMQLLRAGQGGQRIILNFLFISHALSTCLGKIIFQISWIIMRPFWHPRQLECCLSQVAGSNLYHLFLCYFWSIIWENIWVFWNRSDLEVFVTFFDFNGNFHGKMAKILFLAIKSGKSILQPSS